MNDSRQAAFARECDLIMKGGITSGIVYPLAITEIAKAFRLRSIGGTSAGAIAAAAAAAAELGRQRFQSGQLSSDPAGFAEIERLPEHLCKPAADGHGTKLQALFKPIPALRPLFDTFSATLEAKGKGPRARLLAPLKVMLTRHKIAALLGALAAGGPLWGSAMATAIRCYGSGCCRSRRLAACSPLPVVCCCQRCGSCRKMVSACEPACLSPMTRPRTKP